MIVNPLELPHGSRIYGYCVTEMIQFRGGAMTKQHSHGATVAMADCHQLPSYTFLTRRIIPDNCEGWYPDAITMVADAKKELTAEYERTMAKLDAIVAMS